MSKWEHTYIMAVIAMPLYWVLIMAPAVIRKYVVIYGAEDDYVAYQSEPRYATERYLAGEGKNVALARRLSGMHQNGWENFGVFVSAVLAAALGGVKMDFVNNCCLVIIIARFCYNISYACVEHGPLAFLRSTFYGVGLGASAAMWGKAIYEISKADV